MFLFRKYLRNESKIVLLFETFFLFVFSKNAKNKILLGWHAWATIQLFSRDPVLCLFEVDKTRGDIFGVLPRFLKS